MSTELSFKALLQQLSDKFKDVSNSWDEIVNRYTKTNHTKAITLQDWNSVVALLGRTDAYVRGMFPVVEGFGELGDAFSAEVQAMQLDAENAAEDAKTAALDVHTVADILKSKTVESITLTDDFRIKFVFSDGTALITKSVQGPEGPAGPAGEVSVETLIKYVQEALAEAKDYTDEELATFDFIKVESVLPNKGLPNKIYLVPKPDAQTQDLFDEYVWVKDASLSAGGKWEWITTKQIEVDLTPYVKKEEGKGLSTNDLTDQLMANYNTAYAFSQTHPEYATKTTLLDWVYPVGSIYMSTNLTSPQTFLGGTWVRIQGRFLLGAGSNDANSNTTYGSLTAGTVNRSAGERGGTDKHTLTASEMPSHDHEIRADFGTGRLVDLVSDASGGASTQGAYFNSSSAASLSHSSRRVTTHLKGSGAAHNNMPPYLAVYMWKRTA